MLLAQITDAVMEVVPKGADVHFSPTELAAWGTAVAGLASGLVLAISKAIDKYLDYRTRSAEIEVTRVEKTTKLRLEAEAKGGETERLSIDHILGQYRTALDEVSIKLDAAQAGAVALREEYTTCQIECGKLQERLSNRDRELKRVSEDRDRATDHAARLQERLEATKTTPTGSTSPEGRPT